LLITGEPPKQAEDRKKPNPSACTGLAEHLLPRRHGLIQSFLRAGLGVMSLAEVRLQEGESLENALRRFKRKVQTEDIIKEVKRHSYYLKPGEKRRLKQALARKRARKKIRREPD